MKKKSILYILLMILFFVFAYLFISNGINVKVKNFINYEEQTNINYKVYLKDNNIYDSMILGKDKKYISNLVEDIVIDFDYNILYERYLNGFYSYSVDSSLIAYEEDINDSLWTKNEVILPNKVSVIDQNKIDNIKFNDSVKINYAKYKNEVNEFIENYNIDVSGYLLVKINFHLMGEFNKCFNNIEDNQTVKIIIPLTYDTFKINVINSNNGFNNYTFYTKKDSVNYLLIIIGTFCLSIAIALMIVIIKELIALSKSEEKYQKELKSIFKKYEDIIINVDKIYRNNKYNLIYVENFSELMDVYNKVNIPISFKEIEKNRKAVFLIIENNNAWIYILVSDVRKKLKSKKSTH